MCVCVCACVCTAFQRKSRFRVSAAVSNTNVVLPSGSLPASQTASQAKYPQVAAITVKLSRLHLDRSHSVQKVVWSASDLSSFLHSSPQSIISSYFRHHSHHQRPPIFRSTLACRSCQAASTSGSSTKSCRTGPDQKSLPPDFSPTFTIHLDNILHPRNDGS